MESIIYSLTTVGPVFLIIAIGILLRRFGLIDTSLSEGLSRLVFHVFLPALLLKSLIKTDFTGSGGVGGIVHEFLNRLVFRTICRSRQRNQRVFRFRVHLE